VVITQPTVVSAATVKTDITCNGLTDGIMVASASGGNGSPYTYVWSNGATTESISGLAAGAFTVTAYDVLGCSGSSSKTIVEPSALNLVMSFNNQTNNPICPGTLTNVRATVTGGSPAYSYAWSVAGTGFNLTNRAAGPYSVTVTDSRGCKISGSTTVTEFSGGNVTVTAVVDKNSTGSDGEATATATGGNSPYTYAWGNGEVGATATALESGTATVIASDSNGCLSNPFAIEIGVSSIESTINNLSTFVVYPNPNSGIFNVKFNNAENDTYTFEVRNLLGQVISSENVAVSGSFIKEINLTGVNTGVYFLNVRNSQGEKTERIIVK
jgi:hypothetical protein